MPTNQSPMDNPELENLTEEEKEKIETVYEMLWGESPEEESQ